MQRYEKLRPWFALQVPQTALAAIQGLNEKLGEREADLRRDLERKELEIEALKSRLEKLGQLIQAESARQP